MRHANRMECCAQFLKYWRRNSLELRRSIVDHERILPRHSARTEDPKDVSGPGARYCSSDCRQSPLQAAYSVVVGAVLPTAMKVPVCPNNRMVFYEEPSRVCWSTIWLLFVQRTKTHLTLTKHNCCCCAFSSTGACVLLSVSIPVVSLCYAVAAPLVPFAYPRRVAGRGWSCYARIRPQQLDLILLCADKNIGS